MAMGASDTGKGLMAKMALATFGLENGINFMPFSNVSCTSAMQVSIMDTVITFVLNDSRNLLFQPFFSSRDLTSIFRENYISTAKTK